MRCQRSISFKVSLLDLSVSEDSTQTFANLTLLKLNDSINIGLLMQFIDLGMKDKDKTTT